jgi:hypothetical protein
MVDGLHILLWNKTKKPLAIALAAVWRGLEGKEDRGDLTNIQYKPNQNCHYASPHNKYILIKKYFDVLERVSYQNIHLYVNDYLHIYIYSCIGKTEKKMYIC